MAAPYDMKYKGKGLGLSEPQPLNHGRTQGDYPEGDRGDESARRNDRDSRDTYGDGRPRFTGDDVEGFHEKRKRGRSKKRSFNDRANDDFRRRSENGAMTDEEYDAWRDEWRRRAAQEGTTLDEGEDDYADDE